MDAFIDLFDPVPVPVLFAVFIAASLLFVFGLEALVHRRVPKETRERTSTSTAVMIQVLAVFYSVLVAFVIVGERGAITEANDHISQEAAALSALYEDAQGLPPSSRDEVREAIMGYDRSVLEDDLHAIDSTGEPSPQTTERLGDLYAAVQAAEPEAVDGAFTSRQSVTSATSPRRGGAATPMRLPRSRASSSSWSP
jgi:Protein of unknown function (DUF4239)